MDNGVEGAGNVTNGEYSFGYGTLLVSVKLVFIIQVVQKMMHQLLVLMNLRQIFIFT